MGLIIVGDIVLGVSDMGLSEFIVGGSQSGYQR